MSPRRRLSQGELDVIIAAHERYLDGKAGGRLAVLKFVDLSGLDLHKRRLDDADFTGSVFEGSCLIRTRLERAILFGCDLRRADMRGAYLKRADLRGATMKGANLSLADLTQTDFREGRIAIPHPDKGLQAVRHEIRAGELEEVNFSGARLDLSQFDNAAAFRADFTDCSMRGARLNGANLKDANLSGAILDGAEVVGTNLEGARLTGAVLTGVDVDKALISKTDFSGCLRSPDAASLERAEQMLAAALGHQAFALSGGKEGRPAALDGEDLRAIGDRLKGAHLTAISFRGACMVGLNLSGAELQGVCFENADLRGANFADADLRGARLAGANLTKAVLVGAQMGPLPLGGDRSAPVSLSGARLRYADLRKADLTQAVLADTDLTGADMAGAFIGGARLETAILDQVTGLEVELAA